MEFKLGDRHFESFNVGGIYRIKTIEHSVLSVFLSHLEEFKRDLSEFSYICSAVLI